MDFRDFSVWISFLALAVSCLNLWLSRRWAVENEFRVAAREIALTSDQILLEVDMTKKLGERLKGAYSTLAIFAGHGGHSSRMSLALEPVDTKVKVAEAAAPKARAFQEPHRKLDRNEPDTVDLLRVAFIGELGTVRSIRQELADEYAGVEKQNAEFRQRALKG